MTRGPTIPALPSGKPRLWHLDVHEEFHSFLCDPSTLTQSAGLQARIATSAEQAYEVMGTAQAVSLPHCHAHLGNYLGSGFLLP